MSNLFELPPHWVVTWDKLFAAGHAVVILIVGFIVAKTVSRLVAKGLARRVTRHQQQLIRRITLYTLLALFLVSALQHLGFKLSVLLGAAGIVTIALGFAAQTSVSNIISGLFLIAEQPFVIGDSITVDNVTGEVLAIDLLSIKIRTSDNTFVRIPNETLIKAEILNLTRFPIRCFDLPLRVAYKEDINEVRTILLAAADKNPLCLEEPAPTVTMSGFNNSVINLQLSVWSSQKNFTALKNSIQEDVKKAFDENKIEMPVVQVSINSPAFSSQLK